MTARDQEEQDLGIDQMALNIEKMRFDMQHAREKDASDLRKFIVTTVISALIAGAALVAAGVGIGNLIWAHRDAAPQTIILRPPPE